MKIKLLFLTMSLCLGFASCTSDEQDLNTGAKDGAYLDIRVSVPSSGSVTKSSTNDDGTSTDGTQNATNAESKVSTLVVTAVGEDGSIKGAYDIAVLNIVAGGNQVTYETGSFQAEGLAVGDTYKIYVFANTTVANLSLVVGDSFDLNKAYAATDLAGALTYISTDNKFLMTNAEPVVDQLIPTTAADKGTPLAISIKVERTAARFDYKKAAAATSVAPGTSSAMGNDKYLLDGTEADGVAVQLTGYALMNVSKSFYYYKRVSADGTNTAATVGGSETSTNYVVSTNYAYKTNVPANIAAVNNYFFRVIGVPATGVAYQVMGGAADYERLTYCTENTIPGIDNQLNAFTTAVVFKGELSFIGTTAPAFGAKIYIYDNKYYKNWASLYSYLSAYSDLSVTEDDNNVATLQNRGIKRYTPDSEGKYFAYYVYWNRHNDNGKNTEMGPMEFAVVRNNLYKLMINSIAKFGHPTDPVNPPVTPTDPDPDPLDPTDPDESKDVYMNVKVEVLPWVLRINSIDL